MIALLLPIIALLQATPLPKFSVKLYAADTSVQPGGKSELAIEINVEKGWHIYHPIVLDTGAATTIDFAVPPGITFGELRFPTPTPDKEVGLEYLALEGRVIVLTTLQVAADVVPGPLPIQVHVRALVCKELCFPVTADARLTLNVSTQPPAPANAALFKEARAALPMPLEQAKYIEGSSITVSPERVGLDQEAEVVCNVRVKKGHHIQDRDPGVEGLIPSRLFIEKLDGVRYGDQKWPAPQVREIAGFGKARQQGGEFKIRVPLTLIDSEFPSGPVALRVLFTYQCCTDAGVCYPPEAAVGVVRFTAQTPNPPLADGRPLGTLFPALGTDTGQPAGTVATSQAGEQTASWLQTGGAATSEVAVPALTAKDWANGIPWQKWLPGLAQELAQSGHEVYVDYTATWCLTCQANKKLVLDTDAVRAKMQELGVIPIVADFTNQDPAMHKELGRWAPTVDRVVLG